MLSDDAHLCVVGEFARRLLFLCRYRRTWRQLRTVPTVEAVILSGFDAPHAVLAVLRVYWDLKITSLAALRRPTR